jgi:adenylyl-sulfate kinase
MPSETPQSLKCHEYPRLSRQAVVVWLTGLSGAGKTTIATTVARHLLDAQYATVVLDGDDLRRGVCADLGFSPDDRHENVRRTGELACLLYQQGITVLCALVSPYRASRDHVRALLPPGGFVEVHVLADVETCRLRDSKGLYSKASAGQIQDLTGVSPSAPYEVPPSPELTIDTRVLAPDAAAAMVLNLLHARGVVMTGGSAPEEDPRLRT